MNCSNPPRRYYNWRLCGQRPGLPMIETDKFSLFIAVSAKTTHTDSAWCSTIIIYLQDRWSLWCPLLANCSWIGKAPTRWPEQPALAVRPSFSEWAFCRLHRRFLSMKVMGLDADTIGEQANDSCSLFMTFTPTISQNRFGLVNSTWKQGCRGLCETGLFVSDECNKTMDKRTYIY